LYWIGLLEWSRPGVAPWYFHCDILTGDETILELDPADYLDHEENVPTYEFPKYPVKITGYRILNTVVIFGFGLAKTTLVYMGRTTVPITLDWVLSVAAALILYWVGCFEAPRAGGYSKFFHKDCSGDIPNLPTLLGVLVFTGFLGGGHLYVTSAFVAHLIDVTPNDNRVDHACRVIILIWLAVCALVILACLLRLVMYGSSWEDILGAFLAWYFIYFFLIAILSMIKGMGGYRHPSSGGDKEDKNETEWSFCVSIIFFTYCWYW